MPKGGARPGAGRPRKALQTHLLAGSYRRDRHGERPSNVVPMPDSSTEWQPTAADLGAIPEPGRRVVMDLLAKYAFGLIEGPLVLEAGRAVTALDVIRELARKTRPLDEALKLQRLELQWQQRLQSLLLSLKVSTS
jgi:hypothetical protein